MNPKGNILVLTYWDFNDALVQTYTLPYVRIIRKTISEKSKLFLVTFDRNNSAIKSSEEEKIKQELLEEGISWIRFRYFPLGAKAIMSSVFAIFKLWSICIFKGVNFIHAWCTPAGTLGYILSKTTGTSLVIDSYEPHAEAMVENGTWKKNSKAFRLLFLFEKLQTKKAKAVIAAAPGMKEYAKEKYGFSPEMFFTKPACVNLELFSFANRKKSELVKKFNFENKIVCVYAGKLGGIYLTKEVFDFFKTAHEYWGDKFRILFLTSHSSSEIKAYCEASDLDLKIITQLFIPHNEIPDYMGLADFAITPVKPVPTKKYCSPIKDGEYWALGLPVVITPDISEDSALIEQYDAGAVIKSFDKESYLKSVTKIDRLLSSFSTEELYKRIRPVAEKYRNFTIAEKVYEEIYGK